MTANPSPTNQATEKQIAFIKKMERALNNDRQYNFATMTKEQASQIIDELKEQGQEMIEDAYEGNGYGF